MTPLIALIVFIYFMPSIIALARGHQNKAAIIATNIIFGWTFIGWGVALVWSFTNNNSKEPFAIVLKEGQSKILLVTALVVLAALFYINYF